MASVTSLNFNITSRWDGRGVLRARRGIAGLDRNLNNASKGLNTFTGRFKAVGILMGTFTPAALPVINVLAGMGAAFASMAVAAGSAAGIYGLAVGGAIKRTQEMAKEGKKLAPVQAAFMKSMGGMKRAYNDFLKSTQKMTLGTAIHVVNGLTAGLGKLAPVVKAVNPLMHQTAVAFESWTKRGNGLQRFLDSVKKDGVSALTALVFAGRNVLSVLGTGFRAFLPLGNQLAWVLVKASGAMKQWADEGGFQRWIASIKRDGPGVRDFFKAVWDAVKKVYNVLKDFSGASLAFATDIAKMIAVLDVGTVKAFANAWLALKSPFVWLLLNVPGVRDLIIGILGALNPGIVYAMAGAFVAWKVAIWLVNVGLISTPVGWIIIAIAGLIVIIVAIATKTTWFQTAWKKTWAAVKTAIEVTWHFIRDRIFGPIGRFFTQTIPGWANTVKNRVTGAWAQMRAGIATAYNWIKNNVFGPIGRFFTQTIPGWANTVKTRVTGAWAQIRAGINTAWNWIKNNVFGPIGRFFTSTIPGWANTVKNRVVAAWDAVGAGLSRAYNWVRVNVWDKIGNFFTKTIPGWATTVKEKVVRAWELLKDGIKKAWDKVKSIVKVPLNIVIGFINGGILGPMRSIAKFVGLDSIAKKYLNDIPKLAVGGPVRGPGSGTSDSITARLSNNEHVWTAREVAAAGGHKAVAGIRSAVLGGSRVRQATSGFNFDHGGSHDPLKVGDVGPGGTSPADRGAPKRGDGFSIGGWKVPGIGDLIRGALMATVGPLLKGARNAIKNSIGKKPPVREFIGSAVTKPIDWLLDFIKKDDAANMATGGGGLIPWARWKAGDGRRVIYGRAMNVRTRAMLQNAERLRGGRFSVTQGSWSGAAASAGTHLGGGVIDVNPSNTRAVQVMRMSGFAAWGRTPSEGFSPHIHAVAEGDPTVHPSAAAQVRAFFAGRNGLAGNGPDTYRGPPVGFQGGGFGGPGGGAPAVFTSFWDSFQPMASGRRMHGKAIASSYLPLGSQVRVTIGNKSETGVIDDLGPAKFVYNRHPGIAVLDLNEPMMQRMTGRRQNVTRGRWQLLSVGRGRTLFGTRLRGYSEGGPVNAGAMSYDKGGYLQPGLTLAYNGTGRPEPVGHDLGGDGVHVHIHGPVYAKSSLEFEDMVVEAMQRAKRRNRLPR